MRTATRSCSTTRKRVRDLLVLRGGLADGGVADEERVFLISEELEFRTGETPEGDPRLIWRDLQGDVDEFYEFVAAGTNGPTRAFFETCMYRAMYERKYRSSADATQDADLEEFVWKCVL